MTKKEIKQLFLNELYEPYKNCNACPLGSLGRKKVVFGRGNPDAKLMLIGEGPGRDEDLQGIPFVGRSGKLLTTVLASLGIEESEVYITNIVKCRPPKNRTPSPEESNTCMKTLLEKQLSIVQPLAICTLGTCATKTLLKSSLEISKLRGTIQSYLSIPVIPTYHPAYILRTPKKLPVLADDLKLAIKESKIQMKNNFIK